MPNQCVPPQLNIATEASLIKSLIFTTFLLHPDILSILGLKNGDCSSLACTFFVPAQLAIHTHSTLNV